MDAPRGFPAALRTLQALSAAIDNAALVAGQAYAGGGGYRGKPIVSRHFTAGNSERYGWAALSPEYFARKQGQAKENRTQMRRHGITVTAMDKKATTRGRSAATSLLFGASAGVVTGRNLPQLVLRGFLRHAIETTGSVRKVSADLAVCSWQVPEYGEYHHTGAGNNPKRSPVEPNAEDMDEVRAVVEKWLRQVIGRGRTVPAGG